jgi:hypothetical protein
MWVCQEHRDCVVVAKAGVNCPFCEEISDHKDTQAELKEADEQVRELQDQIDSGDNR